MVRTVLPRGALTAFVLVALSCSSEPAEQAVEGGSGVFESDPADPPVGVDVEVAVVTIGDVTLPPGLVVTLGEQPLEPTPWTSHQDLAPSFGLEVIITNEGDTVVEVDWERGAAAVAGSSGVRAMVVADDLCGFTVTDAGEIGMVGACRLPLIAPDRLEPGERSLSNVWVYVGNPGLDDRPVGVVVASRRVNVIAESDVTTVAGYQLQFDFGD